MRHRALAPVLLFPFLAGAASAQISGLGALTGTMYLNVFTSGAIPVVVGRVHLVLAVGGGIVPGVRLNGEFLIEFNSHPDDDYEAHTFSINSTTRPLFRWTKAICVLKATA